MLPAPDPKPLLALGLAVFPLPAGAKAAAPGWRGTIVRPGQPLDAWPHGANLGVGCRANRLVVLDLDVLDGEPVGLRSLARAAVAIAARPGDAGLPQTLTVDTPSGGEHRYYRLPAGAVIGSTSGGTSGLGPGIDTRGPGRSRGGYVVGPGSVLDGRRYRIREPDVPIAELPAWIADRLQAVAALRAGRRAGLGTAS